MNAIKRINVYRTINSICVDVWDGLVVIDEFEINSKSDDSYGKIREFVNKCKEYYICRINDEDGIL